MLQSNEMPVEEEQNQTEPQQLKELIIQMQARGEDTAALEERLNRLEGSNQ